MRLFNRVQLPTFEVVEISKTKEKDGKYQGLPVVLIRMGGCNLRCQWCDSKYTWEFHTSVVKELRAETVVEMVKKASTDGRNVVLITGGEPMLWQVNAGWVDMLRRLKKAGFIIHIETNGTVTVKDEVRKYIDFFDISPKASLYPGMYNRTNTSSYRQTEHIWKFVISGLKDILDVISFCTDWGLKEDDIYVMGVETFSGSSQSNNYIRDEGLDLLRRGGIKAKFTERIHPEETFYTRGL